MRYTEDFSGHDVPLEATAMVGNFARYRDTRILPAPAFSDNRERNVEQEGLEKGKRGGE
jgi:hypothetical protein